MFAKGTKKGTEYQAILDSNQSLLHTLKTTRSRQQAMLQQLDTAESQATRDIDNHRDLLVKMIDEKAKDDKRKVKDKFTFQKDIVKECITTANHQIDAAEAIIKSLNEAKGDNESELFVYIKQGEATQHDGEHLLHTLHQHNQSIPRYQLHNSIQESLNKVSSLGDFVDEPASEKHVKLQLRGEPKVKVAWDESQCRITGVCFLPDGSLMMADYDNKRLKQLNTSFKVTRHLDMGTVLCDVCYLNSNNEVAVTLTVKKSVQFVDVGASLKKTRSFPVGDICHGISCSRGELFVCCGSAMNQSEGNVRVFSLSGTLLHTIQQGPSGQNIFSVLNNITLSSCGNFLHIADRNKGIITTGRKGNLLATFSDPDLITATAICTLENDDLLVCGMNSHTILHVTRDGLEMLGVVLRQQDELFQPLALVYDCINSRLIVTDKSDTIKVYDVQHV